MLFAAIKRVAQLFAVETEVNETRSRVNRLEAKAVLNVISRQAPARRVEFVNEMTAARRVAICEAAGIYTNRHNSATALLKAAANV